MLLRLGELTDDAAVRWATYRNEAAPRSEQWLWVSDRAVNPGQAALRDSGSHRVILHPEAEGSLRVLDGRPGAEQPAIPVCLEDVLGWSRRGRRVESVVVAHSLGAMAQQRGAARDGAQGARAYWANNGFSANVLDNVPNESRLTPAEWGEADVE